MGKMKALNFDPRKKCLNSVLKDIPKAISPDDIVLRVSFAGICGTDLHIAEGTFPCKDTDFTLGHEISGIVTEVGKNVDHIQRGDNVVVDPNSGCNKCRYCTNGSYHLCMTGGINNTIGIFQDGGWAEYCIAPAFQVYKLPNNIPLQRGTGYITVTPEQLQTQFPKKDDCLKNGFDLCIDCSGNPRAIEKGVDLLRNGGRMCIFGVAPVQSEIKLSPFEIYKKEITIIGVNINPFSFNKAMALLEAFGERYLDYETLGIQTFGLDQHQEALEKLKQGKISKGVFKI
ncbi:L-threonine 3-dehydrogenase-like isoform X2 [Hetaerina americana]|uniref:L-threonine 3-dehydrogenase-like isoform X2 n=1 Tax=Hetaerina americana TaxID=62018 RepID=UPI003A7F1216